jgi:hypothetical protein
MSFLCGFKTQYLNTRTIHWCYYFFGLFNDTTLAAELYRTGRDKLASHKQVMKLREQTGRALVF